MNIRSLSYSLTLFLLLSGCGSPEKIERLPRKPEMVLTIGYLDLSSHRGRIERKGLVSLSGILKKEKIDILCVTGITRYPGLPTRTDFVDVLSSLADLRHVFGLASDNQGRLKGNAVFSVYPFHSTATIPFDDKQDEHTSAVFAVVDGGVSEVQVINTLLPPNSPERHLRAAIGQSEEDNPLVLLGNLPKNPSAGFTAPAQMPYASPIWLREGETAELLGLRSVSSVYGKMTITQVGLFRPYER